jgi:hypothetical protein
MMASTALQAYSGYEEGKALDKQQKINNRKTYYGVQRDGKVDPEQSNTPVGNTNIRAVTPNDIASNQEPVQNPNDPNQGLAQPDALAAAQVQAPTAPVAGGAIALPDNQSPQNMDQLVNQRYGRV